MGTQRSLAIYIQIPWQNYTIQSSSGSSLFGHLSNYFITKRENGEQIHCVSSKSQKNYMFLKWNCKRKPQIAATAILLVEKNQVHILNTLFEPRGIQIIAKKVLWANWRPKLKLFVCSWKVTLLVQMTLAQSLTFGTVHFSVSITPKRIIHISEKQI